MKKVVFTSCNLAYLDRAMVLASTVKAHTPNVMFVLMLSDHVDIKYFSQSKFACFDHVLDTANIGIPDFYRWSFQYDVVELCTAVKGYCFRYLFNAGYEKILYLDPDIACYGSLDFLFSLLDDYSILLTPHQLLPAKTTLEIVDNELCSHKHGIFNLGFLGLKSSSEGQAFVDWWSERLRDYCLDDIPNGMFTDQKWCDAVPSYFESFKVIRHEGCNVASWNLCERRISIKDGIAWINDRWPLIFYHYTKYFSAGVPMTKRYAQTVESIDLWNWYGVLIAQARLAAGTIEAANKYGRYNDGGTIQSVDRRAFRSKLYSGLVKQSCNPYEKRDSW